MIYFIRIGSDGPIKVGYTDGPPHKRLRQLQGACPYALELIAVADGGLETERDLHGKFSDARLRGEWFNPTPELSAYIVAHSIAPIVARYHCGPGRPKSPDPKIQKAIYPGRSLWQRVEETAKDDGKKPAERAVELIEKGLRFEQGAGRFA